MVTYSGWNGHDAVNLDQIRGSGAIQLMAPAGRLNPAHCTATGEVFLASLTEEALAHRLRTALERFTAQTIIDTVRLRKHLIDIRNNGYAVRKSEFLEEVFSVAAPIASKDKQVHYAVAVIFPTYRATDEKLDRLIPQLLFTIKQISADLHR